MIDVQLKHIDDDSKYFYPSRTLELKTKSKNILTPIRIATNSEYNAKANIPAEVVISNDIEITHKRLNANKMKDFLQNNGYHSTLLRNLQAIDNMAQYALLRIILLQPTSTGTNSKQSGMDVLTGSTQAIEKYLRLIIKMQDELNHELITIPYIRLPFSKLIEMWRDVDDGLEKRNKQPLFFVDIKYNDFENAIDFLVNKIGAKMIGLLYGKYWDWVNHYEHLLKYKKKDVAFVMAGVSREDRNNLSTMHGLQFLGNDLLALDPPKFGGKPLTLDITRIRSLNKEHLTIEPITQAIINQPDKMLADMDGTNDKDLRKVVTNYREAQHDVAKYSVLNSVSKVYELKTSTKEFMAFQPFIKSGETEDYVNTKSALKSFITSLHRPLV